MAILDAVEHLVGLQAQATPPPYYGLWSRLRGFRVEELGALLEAGALVRMTLMRATVHMVTPRDAAFLRPLVQLVIERNHKGAFGRRMGEVTPAAVLAGVREQLPHGPRTAREIARAIGGDEEARGQRRARVRADHPAPAARSVGQRRHRALRPARPSSWSRSPTSSSSSCATCARSAPRRSWTARSGAGSRA